MLVYKQSLLKDVNEFEVFSKLEGLAKSKLKVPKKVHKERTNKITSIKADDFIAESRNGPWVGNRSSTDQLHSMAEIMKHSYLQKAME